MVLYSHIKVSVVSMFHMREPVNTKIVTVYEPENKT